MTKTNKFGRVFDRVKRLVRSCWREIIHQMTPEEERRSILWNEAQCGVKRCKKCGAKQ